MEHRDGFPDVLLLILILVGHAAHVAVGAPRPAIAGGLGPARQVGEDVAEQHEHILPLVVHAAHTACGSSAQLAAGGGSTAGSGARALGDRSEEAMAMTHLGNTHLQLGEVHKSIHLQQQALQLLSAAPQGAQH